MTRFIMRRSADIELNGGGTITERYSNGFHAVPDTVAAHTRQLGAITQCWPLGLCALSCSAAATDKTHLSIRDAAQLGIITFHSQPA